MVLRQLVVHHNFQNVNYSQKYTQGLLLGALLFCRKLQSAICYDIIFIAGFVKGFKLRATHNFCDFVTEFITVSV